MLPESIAEQQRAILSVHGCQSRHVATKRVREVFNKLVAWEGDVEVYELSGHPKAKRCYAWTVEEHGKMKTVAVLEIPPVDSAETAVKIAIAAKTREK